MFSAQNLQINRGSLTANAQGKFVTTLHTYRDDTLTVASIQLVFPPYLGQGATQDKIAVGDHILILGSDTTTFNKILDLDPFTVGTDLFSGASSLSLAPPIVAVDANAARITGNILEMEIADATHPGIVTIGAQNFGGIKSFPAGLGTDTINEITPANGTVINTNRIGAALIDFPTANVVHFMQGNTNIAIGANVLNLTTVGSENVGIGPNALVQTTSGDGNVAVGESALLANTTGQFNTAIGAFTLAANTVGNNLVAVGVAALQANTTGGGNTAIGGGALNANTTGSLNVGVGDVALAANTTGEHNTAIGANALLSNTTGINNVSVGTNSMANNINGNQNVAIGESALEANTTGTNNIAIGQNALTASTTQSSSIGIGTNALSANTTGGANVGIGTNCLMDNTTGSFNTGLGTFTLRTVTTGGQNTAIGYLALNKLTTGNQNCGIGNDTFVDLTTGTDNVAVGGGSLNALTTGTQNVGLGVAVADALTTGSQNIMIGYLAGDAYTGAESDNILLLNAGVVGESGVIRIGEVVTHVKNFQAGIRGVTTDVADAIAVLIDSAGQLGTASSLRSQKENIKTIDANENSEIIKKLNPVRFDYIGSKGRNQQFGLIAEEVAEVFEDICAYETVDGKEQLKTIYYDRLPIMLLREVQRLQAEVELLKSK